VALAQRAVLAIDRGDWPMAASMAKEARDVVSNAHLEGYQVTALANAVLARVAIHDGDPLAAKAELGRAMSLRSQLTATFPWLNVAALVGLARAYLELGDPDAAATLLVQASDVVRQRPHLGGLAGQVRSLQASIAILPVGPRGASTLTSAELRVLAFLPLYLSFKEIGQRLGVRASTVQTHAMAIYGKLGASSRSEAVDRAIDARLLEGPPNWYPDLP